jgi:hypothetical protein
MQNRVIAAVIVGLGQVGVLILIWESRLPTDRKDIVLDVGTMFFFSASTTARRSGERSGRPTLKPLHLKPPTVNVSESLRSTIPSVVTLPPLPESSAPSGVSWQSEITDVASDMIERARVEAGRAMDRPQRSPSFSPLHEKPHTFEWISQHSHEVIDEHGVPQWVLVQPCESEFLVQKPDCTVERVLRYGGPNAIP